MEFIDKGYTYAVIGASNNPSKAGYWVMEDLYNAGYCVVPVNLKEETILGLEVYRTLSDFPFQFDVVIIVIPPDAVMEVLPEVKRLGIKKVWFQPGSESDEAKRFCRNNGIDYVMDTCIMVEHKK